MLRPTPAAQPRHPSLLRLLAVLSLATLSTAAHAQREPCALLLEQAEAFYVNQAFAEAEEYVRTCLNQPGLPDTTAIAGHRLLALILLRQNQMEDAREAIVRLLGVSYAYEPDPVQDPPSYVALVQTIKGQLRVALPEEAAPPEEAPPEEHVPPAETVPFPPADFLPAERPAEAARRLQAALWFGSTSYGGERGVNTGGAFAEFADNGGPSLGLDLGLSLTDRFAVSMGYRASRLPTLVSNRTAPRDPVLDEADSSDWIHALTLAGRGRGVRIGPISPFVQVGVGLTLARLNGTHRAGLHLQPGLQLEVALIPEVALYTTLDLAFVRPGDALDLSARSAEYDLLTSFGLGVRYRLPVRW